MDIKALKTVGAWSGLVTTLVLIMMAITGIITPGDALFYAGGVLVGLLFAAYVNRHTEVAVETDDSDAALPESENPTV